MKEQIDVSKLPNWMHPKDSELWAPYLVWQRFLWKKVCELWNNTYKNDNQHLITDFNNWMTKKGPVKQNSNTYLNFVDDNDKNCYCNSFLVKQLCKVDADEINKDFPVSDITYAQIIEALYTIAYYDNEYIWYRIKNRASNLQDG